jgi:hypothetical protein
MISNDFTPKYKRYHLRQITGLIARTILSVACCTVNSGVKKAEVQAEPVTWEETKASRHSWLDFLKSAWKRPLKSLCLKSKPESEACGRLRSPEALTNFSTGIFSPQLLLNLNYNITDLAPAAIATKLPEALVNELLKADAGQKTSVLGYGNMQELHSVQRRLLITEINQAKKPTLRLIVGVTPLVNWVREAGQLKKAGVILTRLKQVTVNIVGLEILRHIDPTKFSSVCGTSRNFNGQ